MPAPSLTTTYILALIGTVVGLFVTQNLISNDTAQLVTGLAAVVVPLGLALAHTFFHTHVEAARVHARELARVTVAAPVVAPPVKP